MGYDCMEWENQRPGSEKMQVLLKEDPSSEGCHLATDAQCRGFYSTLFLLLKKNMQMRSVINLKQLNQWVDTPHFKMEGISTLRDLLRARELW